LATFARVVGRVVHQRRLLAATVGCSFAVAVFQTVSIGALVPFFDTLFRRDRSPAIARVAEAFGDRGKAASAWLDAHLLADPFRALVAISVLLVVFVLLKGIAQFFQELSTGALAHRTQRDLGDELWGRLLDQPYRSVADAGAASLASRFAVDLDQISDGIKSIFSKAFLEPLKAVGAVLLVFALQPTLAALSLIVFPVLFVALVALGRSVRRRARRVLDSRASLLTLIHQGLRGLRVVKAFGAERHERRRFARENEALYRKQMRIIAADAAVSPLMELVGTLAVAACTIVGGRYVVRGEMSPGEFITFYVGLVAVYDPIRRFGNTYNRLQSASAAAERVFEILDRPAARVDRPDAVEAAPLREAIEFDDVHFAYDGEREVLRGASFRLERGERVALVGLSGAGKTTLVNLLLGFETPTRGRILVDGMPLDRLRLASWRAQVGLVTQDVVLFDDTVIANVAYGVERPDLSRVQAACRTAHADAFVERLPDVWDTRLGENGSTLSGGQRQRIALARALHRDPSVLVLDEATSAVDRDSDDRILEALAEEGRKRTILVIAHRESSLAGCDRVLRLEGGRVTESGGVDGLVRGRRS
jgi:ATP-binding cassette, subfamily B, bacterial MsbA